MRSRSFARLARVAGSMLSLVATAFRQRRHIVAACVVVFLLGPTLAVTTAIGAADAQVGSARPDWAAVSGEFERTEQTYLTDSKWEFYSTDPDGVYAIIEWGIIDGGRGTSGKRTTEHRRRCHGPGDVDLNGVQFEITWEAPNYGGFVPCSDLTPLFGAKMNVQLKPGELRSFNCDLVYSYYSGVSGGITLVDCLTVNGVERPSVLPKRIILEPSGLDEEFSVATVEPRRVRNGRHNSIGVQLLSSDGGVLVNRRLGVELVAGPTYRSQASSAVLCHLQCFSNAAGEIRIGYRVADVSREEYRSNTDLTDRVRVFLDRNANGRFDAAREPFNILDLPLTPPVHYVALGDSYSSGEIGAFDDKSNTFDGETIEGAYLSTAATQESLGSGVSTLESGLPATRRRETVARLRVPRRSARHICLYWRDCPEHI